ALAPYGAWLRRRNLLQFALHAYCGNRAAAPPGFGPYVNEPQLDPHNRSGRDALTCVRFGLTVGAHQLQLDILEHEAMISNARQRVENAISCLTLLDNDP